MDTSSFVAPRSVSFKNPSVDSPLRNTLAGVVAALEEHPAWAGVLATNHAEARVVFRKPPPFPLEAAFAGEPVAVRDRDLGRAANTNDEPFSMADVLEEALRLGTSSKNSQVTVRVSRILARLGYERRRRPTLPRGYHYVRVAVPPSHRPSTLEQTSEVPVGALEIGGRR